jgi:metal-responsive CopG/Arc/MetJ family transcriptional regulator
MKKPENHAVGRAITIRLHPDLERAIANWIKRHHVPKPSRSEAIRQLLAEALARK